MASENKFSSEAHIFLNIGEYAYKISVLSQLPDIQCKLSE